MCPVHKTLCALLELPDHGSRMSWQALPAAGLSRNRLIFTCPAASWQCVIVKLPDHITCKSQPASKSYSALAEPHLLGCPLENVSA